MSDEIELLKKEHLACRGKLYKLGSFELIEWDQEALGVSNIVKSKNTGKYFEIYEAVGNVTEFTEVVRVEETKVAVSWLPV